MMARSSKAPSIGRIQKRKTNFSKSSLFGLQRAAGPYRWANSTPKEFSRIARRGKDDVDTPPAQQWRPNDAAFFKCAERSAWAIFGLGSGLRRPAQARRLMHRNVIRAKKRAALPAVSENQSNVWFRQLCAWLFQPRGGQR